VPIFFVLMGIQVRLETFVDLSVLGVAAGSEGHAGARAKNETIRINLLKRA